MACRHGYRPFDPGGDAMSNVEFEGMQRKIPSVYRKKENLAEKCKELDDAIAVLDLICSLASQEWQDVETGKRMVATDNSGKRMWFIGDEIMNEARTILANLEKP